MADSTENAATEEAKPKGKLKLIIIIAGVMLLEAGGITAVFMLGGPAKSGAEVDPDLVRDVSEQTREISIVDDRFQNMKEGRVWIWDISIFVKVKNRHAERVEATLEQRGAEIRQGVSQIVARAQHAHLKEADRQTLNRQLTVYLEDVFGTDTAGESRIDLVLIPKCRGLPSDF